MSNQQHTPGPWDVATKAGDGGLVVRSSKSMHELCQIHSSYKYKDAHKANARLIAAAPEILEALEDCERNMIISTQADMARLDRIRAAIAKAKGEQP